MYLRTTSEFSSFSSLSTSFLIARFSGTFSPSVAFSQSGHCARFASKAGTRNVRSHTEHLNKTLSSSAITSSSLQNNEKHRPTLPTVAYRQQSLMYRTLPNSIESLLLNMRPLWDIRRKPGRVADRVLKLLVELLDEYAFRTHNSRRKPCLQSCPMLYRITSGDRSDRFVGRFDSWSFCLNCKLAQSQLPLPGKFVSVPILPYLRRVLRSQNRVAFQVRN